MSDLNLNRPRIGKGILDSDFFSEFINFPFYNKAIVMQAIKCYRVPYFVTRKWKLLYS